MRRTAAQARPGRLILLIPILAAAAVANASWMAHARLPAAVPAASPHDVIGWSYPTTLVATTVDARPALVVDDAGRTHVF